MSGSGSLRCQIASFIFFLLGFGAFLGAFGSDFWMEEENTNWGLWRMCSSAGCRSTVGTDLMSAPFVGAQAMMCIALICGVVALGSHIAWFATKSPTACVIAWATGVSSGFCTAIAMVCWGSESIRYYGANVLSWSFWLALGSCGLMTLNSAITGCTTGCGTDLDDMPSGMGYRSSRPPVPIQNHYVYDGPQAHEGPHNSSDQTYSDITHEYSMGNMNAHARPGPPLPKGHMGNARY